MTTITPNPSQIRTEQLGPRKVKLVKWWAVLGSGFLAVYAYSITRWLLGGHAHATDPGPDAVPTGMLIGLRINEAVTIGFIFVAIYFALYKPWRQTRQLGLDGILYITFVLFWFQDTVFNYSTNFFAYNSASFNLGCPMCFLPGWLGHSESYAESIAFGFASYCGIAWLAFKIGVLFAQSVRRRRPRMGTAGIVLTILVFFFFFDLLTEVIWLRMGVYSYAGAAGGPKWLTLFSGHYYQLPIWELVLAAFWFGSVVALWFFKNDKGQILAERGLDELRGSPRKIQTVRLLACIGLFQGAILVAYNLPMNFVALHWNQWPKDVQKRSYFTHGVCGPGTSYACPDPRIPLPHGTSARVAPDGKMFAPKGLPEPVQR